jgi:hypothetical protein
MKRVAPQSQPRSAEEVFDAFLGRPSVAHKAQPRNAEGVFDAFFGRPSVNVTYADDDVKPRRTAAKRKETAPVTVQDIIQVDDAADAKKKAPRLPTVSDI